MLRSLLFLFLFLVSFSLVADDDPIPVLDSGEVYGHVLYDPVKDLYYIYTKEGWIIMEDNT
jgi:hypothetical protein